MRWVQHYVFFFNVLFVSAMFPAWAWAQFDPFNLPAEAYVAPNRLFSAEMPMGWDATVDDKDNKHVTLRTGVGSGASVEVRAKSVPKGATPSHFLMFALEHDFNKLPMITYIKKQKDRKFNGNKAASVSGTYAYQGNAEYIRYFEHIIVFTGTAEVFELHFECVTGFQQTWETDLKRIYDTFTFHPVEESQMPFTPREDENLNKIPF